MSSPSIWGVSSTRNGRRRRKAERHHRAWHRHDDPLPTLVHIGHHPVHSKARHLQASQTLARRLVHSIEERGSPVVTNSGVEEHGRHHQHSGVG